MNNFKKSKKIRFIGVACFPTPEERLEYFNKNLDYISELYSFEDNTEEHFYEIYFYKFEKD